MKLAVQLPTYGARATPENILLVARFADERGLDSVWPTTTWSRRSTWHRPIPTPPTAATGQPQRLAERISVLRRLCEEQDRGPDGLVLVAHSPVTAGEGRLEQIAELGVHVCFLISSGRPQLTVQPLGRPPAEIS